jgi:hypothetical protein
VLILIQGEAARNYLADRWQSKSYGMRQPTVFDMSEQTKLSDIPYIVELAQQELLPAEARDEMYQILRDMVPQFDKVDAPNE